MDKIKPINKTIHKVEIKTTSLLIDEELSENDQQLDEIYVSEQRINDKISEYQLNILKQLLDILELRVNDSKSFIDKPDVYAKKEQILDLYSSIEIFYPVVIYTAIKKSKDKTLALIRNILKFHNHTLIYKQTAVKDVNEKIIKVYRYHVIRDV